MEPRIENIGHRLLVGMRISTSLAENRTRELWQGFKPRLTEIEGRSSTDFYSVQIFDADTTLETMTPATMFEKWAAVEVLDHLTVPDGMERLELEGGTYAVFIHRGTPAAFPATSAFIHGKWLPASEYEVDNRPHFEIMGAAYRPDDPNAEEEIWVPVKLRTRT